MNNKYLPLLLLSLGICSGTILFDRFVVGVPDWMAIILIIIALGSLFLYIYLSRKNRT